MFQDFTEKVDLRRVKKALSYQILVFKIHVHGKT